MDSMQLMFRYCGVSKDSWGCCDIQTTQETNETQVLIPVACGRFHFTKPPSATTTVAPISRLHRYALRALKMWSLVIASPCYCWKRRAMRKRLRVPFIRGRNC